MWGRAWTSGNVSCMIKPGQSRRVTGSLDSPAIYVPGEGAEASICPCRVGDWLLVRVELTSPQRLPVDSQSQSERSDASLIREECTHTDCQLPSRATTAYLGLVKGNEATSHRHKWWFHLTRDTTTETQWLWRQNQSCPHRSKPSSAI